MSHEISLSSAKFVFEILSHKRNFSLRLLHKNHEIEELKIVQRNIQSIHHEFIVFKINSPTNQDPFFRRLIFVLFRAEVPNK